MTEINKILEERGARYGKFKDHANIAQRLKYVIHDAMSANKKEFQDDQTEALDMICHKIARILNGDPDYSDSWRDIAGYATLVADRLDGVEK
jgi:hypothetical protein